MVLAASPSTAKEMSHSGHWRREGVGCYFCCRAVAGSLDVAGSGMF